MVAAEPGAAGASAPVESGPSSAGPLAAWLAAPLLAAQFLTVIPPVLRRPIRQDELGRAETFFPLVGLLLGGVLVAVDTVLAAVAAPMVRDVLVIATLAVLTGGLHLDGLADTFDGLFGGHDPERRLEIMRDPRAGSFGVAALGLILLLKLAALGALDPAGRVGALLVAPCLGRWAIVLAMGSFPYARSQGLGLAFTRSQSRLHLAGAGALAAIVAGLAAGLAGLLLWAGASAFVLLAGRWVSARLGGLSGDVYGAFCELVETGSWVALGLHVGTLAVRGGV